LLLVDFWHSLLNTFFLEPVTDVPQG